MNLISRREIIKNLWNGYLATNLETLAYGQLPEGRTKTDINDFFNIVKISENSEYKFDDGLTIRPIQTMHVVNSGDFLDSFGLMVYHNDKKIFFTGDTQFSPYQMMMMYEKADLIIHDCETGGSDYLTNPFKSGVHAHFSDLFGLSKEIKAKMYLIHYGDNITRGDNARAIECGFKGFLYDGDEVLI
jgi:ribonuclease BN (tRNA processing enzyme)